jgi:hypothetical protein
VNSPESETLPTREGLTLFDTFVERQTKRQRRRAARHSALLFLVRMRAKLPGRRKAQP